MTIDSRRSNRLALHVPVEISYTDAQGQHRLERTHTLSVDRNGARIASQSNHPVGSIIHLGLLQAGRSAHGRVVWCSSVSGAFEVGVEIATDDDLWGLHFAPVATPLEAVNESYAAAFAVLVQILQEKGVLGPGELGSRLKGAGYAAKGNRGTVY
jgi:hypothetical protein